MIVLDSSALLAILLDEPHADAVRKELPRAVISTANLAEVLSAAERKGVDSEAAYSAIHAMGVGIVAVDVVQARLAGKISRAPRSLNLSLGDRLCIALAIALEYEVLTADRGMARFTAGTTVRLFR